MLTPAETIIVMIVIAVAVMISIAYVRSITEQNRRLAIANKSDDEIFELAMREMFYKCKFEAYCIRKPKRTAKRLIVKRFLADNGLIDLRTEL